MSTSKNKQHSRSNLGAKRFAFIALLGLCAAFAVLFGVGVIKQTVVSEYVVYVLLGGLAAVLTFEILTSTGEINGEQYGISFRLGGAIVPLVIITGGGLWFSRSAPEFQVKIKFQEVGAASTAITANVRLESGTRTWSAVLHKQDIAIIDHIPNSVKGNDATLTLVSEEVALRDPTRRYKMDSDTLMSVDVVKRLRQTLSGTITLENVPISGGSVLVKGRDCKSDIINGYFSVHCDEVVLPAKLLVSLPEIYRERVCSFEFTIERADGNAIELTPCDRTSTQPIDPAPPPVDPIRQPADPTRKPASVDGAVDPPDVFSATKTKIAAMIGKKCQKLEYRETSSRMGTDLIMRCSCSDGVHELSVASHVPNGLDESGLSSKSFQQLVNVCK